MKIDSKEQLEYKISEMRKTYDGFDFTEDQIDNLMEPSVSFFTTIFEEGELNKRLDENNGSQTGEVLDKFIDFIDRTYFDNDEDKEMLQRTAEEIVCLSEMTDELISTMDHKREDCLEETIKNNKIIGSHLEEYARLGRHILSATNRLGIQEGFSVYESVDALSKEIINEREILVYERTKIDESIAIILSDYDGWYDKRDKKGNVEELTRIINEVLQILNGDLK